MLEYLFSMGVLGQLSKGGMAGGSKKVGLGIGLQQMMGMNYSDDVLIGQTGTLDEAKSALKNRSYQANHFGFDTKGSYSPEKGMFKNAMGGVAPFGVIDQTKAPSVTKAGFSLLGPAMSAYFVYDGWQQDGFKGAAEALLYDVAVSTAIGNYSHHQAIASSVKMEGGKAAAKYGVKTLHSFGMLGTMGIGVGAAVGFEMGKEQFGLPGGMMGAFAGGKLMQMTLRGGKSTLAALGIGGAIKLADMGAAYMQEKVADRKSALSIGGAYHRSKRGIDTANNMASFYTQNANTMRSRSVMAMRNSHMNARSALGMEATFMHSSKDYFSGYRR
tara:strand:- start:1425 stop:2411 length:987 start_codon:yes stop_codon:yes gene_type:complete